MADGSSSTTVEAEGAIASVEVIDAAPPADAPSADTKRRLSEAPLRAKVGAIVLIGAVSGAIVGLIESRLGNQVWPLALMLTAAIAVLIPVAQGWIAAPFDELLFRLDRLTKLGTSLELRALPTDREDEVGKIARIVRDANAAALRHDHEARRLRRTMNASVEDATKRATRRLHEMAMRDALTRLGNRRFLDDQLESLCDAARESGTELVCIAMDMDGFKQINDKLGHGIGDEYLILLSDLIRGSIRDNDLGVRLGGDEFVVFMPGADSQRANHFTDRVRQLFRQQTRGLRPDGPHADISAGVALLLYDRCADGQALLHQADEHLYAAKRAGKGCTIGTNIRP